MRFIFLSFLISQMAVLFSSESKAIESKNYAYLTLGIQPSMSSNFTTTQQLGFGYKIHTKRNFLIDGVDISASIVNNQSTTDTYKQAIFPKILLIHYLMNKQKPIYIGFGGGYLKSELHKTIEYPIAGSSIKVREKHTYNNLTANAVFGIILFKSPSMISFCQSEINLPYDSYFSKNSKEFITMAFTMNIGF